MYSSGSTLNELDAELHTLIENGLIHKINSFYLKENSTKLVEKRLKGNQMAQQIMPKALKRANLISKFPYIEGVALSGSISKGYFDTQADVDFFIITKPKRLWVARTLLVLFKKICLLNSSKYFCINYFISSDNLLIEEQNKFTAMELATLIPTHGVNVFNTFFVENNWVTNYFPNKSKQTTLHIKPIKKGMIAKGVESVFNTKTGAYLDTFFRKITLNIWRKKFKHLTKDEFNISMKSTKKASKHHPQNYQKKVIDKLNNAYQEIEKKYNYSLEKEHA